MAFQTRFANCASTVATWLTVRDTVAVDTLARLATSRMSTRPLFPSANVVSHSIRYLKPPTNRSGRAFRAMRQNPLSYFHAWANAAKKIAPLEAMGCKGIAPASCNVGKSVVNVYSSCLASLPVPTSCFKGNIHEKTSGHCFDPGHSLASRGLSPCERSPAQGTRFRFWED